MGKKRIGWIDAAKGLAMILVVLGHNPMPPLAVKIIYALNVPIFFMMSGYTFNTEKYSSVFTLIKRLFVRTIVPYIIMNLIAFPIYYYARGMAIDSEQVVNLLKGMLFGAGTMSALRTNIPLWFLPCVCVVQCMWYIIDKYAKKTKILWIIIASVIGYFIPVLLSVRLPWGSDVAFTGVVFFALGSTLRNEKSQNILFKIPPDIGFVSALVLNLAFNFLNMGAQPNVDINAMVFGNYFLFYLSALSGCMAVIYLALLLDKSIILGYIGRNTLWILGLHSVFIQIFELILKLNFVNVQAINSLILCALEIACVCVLKLIYDGVNLSAISLKQKIDLKWR